MKPGEEALDGPPIHGNTRLEVIWTAIPAIILVALCSYAYVVLTDIEDAQAGEMRIDVTGQQFAWTFTYPGNGGKPVTSTQLYLPKGKPVRFFVKSEDVIHDFWVPAFRMKIDAVPGITTDYRVTPTRAGRYTVVCAELCGAGHAFMRQRAHVVSPAAYSAWLRKQQNPGRNAAPGGATAGGGAGPDGKTIFTGDSGCSGCHTLADANATGTTGPDLDKVLPGQSVQQIQESIVNPDAEIAKGYQKGIMPATFEDTLQPAEIKALATYLQKVAGK
jgi:cytochrome c oxidase subunit 2